MHLLASGNAEASDKTDLRELKLYYLIINQNFMFKMQPLATKAYWFQWKVLR